MSISSMECTTALTFTSGETPGKPEAVLIRALEPVGGQEIMEKRRGVVTGKVSNLTNGPGRLCMAMAITKAQHKQDLTVFPSASKRRTHFQRGYC